MGVVGRNIGLGLHNLGHKVISLGWSSAQSLDLSVPWKVYTTSKDDYYGKNMFDNVVAQENPDIVLTIGDIWTHSYIGYSKYRGLFQWVGYVAIDGAAYNNKVPTSWIKILNDMDKIVAYTNYGKKVIGDSIPKERSNIDVIYHGVDTKKYFTLQDFNRNELRKGTRIPDDSVVYLFVARNQFRKSVPELLKTWAKFTKDGKHDRAILWLHTVFNDPAGWNLNELIEMYGIKNTVMYLTDYANSGTNLEVIKDEQLNILYNISDAFVLVSGEGFGLPIFEAMSCSKPVVVVNHSACQELAGDGRGLLVDVQTTITGAHSTERPIFNEDSLLKQLDILYNSPELIKEHGKLGNEFVQQFSWKRLSFKWDKCLKKVMNPFLDTCKLTVIS